MRYLVASDVHGSSFYANKLIEKFIEEKCDKLILLGDLYYHGPRNDLPYEYAPKEVIKLFNSYKDKIIAIKGNCDAEVDEMVSEFKFVTSYEEVIDGKKVLFTHGHHLDELKEHYDVVVFGHIHLLTDEEKDGTRFVNPGSVSIPRNDNSRNYLIIDQDKCEIKNLLTSEVVDSFAI